MHYRINFPSIYQKYQRQDQKQNNYYFYNAKSDN